MRTAAAAVMLVAAAGAFGAPVPPPNRPEPVASKPTLKVAPASRLTLGRFQIELGRTTLYDVLEAAKVGTIVPAGSIHYLCLTDADAGRRDRLWLVSTPQGGTTRVITKLMADLLPEGAKASNDCPQLPPVMRPASLDRGVWVGMTETALRQKLGKPSAANGEWLDFHYAGTAKGKGDTVSVLDVLARDGKVQALDASHVTTR